MKSLLLFCFTLVSPVFCASVNNHIVGGSDASISSYNYHLSLQASESHVCSASLISAFRAVTVAHCGGSPLSVYTVLGGTANRSDTTCSTCVVRTLNLFMRHPNFINDANIGYRHDIAVIGFSSIAVNDNLDFIDLATVDDGTYEGENCDISGWGKTATGGGISDLLQAATVPVISYADCVDYWDNQPIFDTQICIRSPDATACGGDSGSPLVCDGLLAGAASWGSDLCSPPVGLPYVYVRISSYYEWIIEQ